jgi:hypothetical protein
MGGERGMTQRQVLAWLVPSSRADILPHTPGLQDGRAVKTEKGYAIVLGLQRFIPVYRVSLARHELTHVAGERHHAHVCGMRARWGSLIGVFHRRCYRVNNVAARQLLRGHIVPVYRDDA